MLEWNYLNMLIGLIQVYVDAASVSQFTIDLQDGYVWTKQQQAEEINCEFCNTIDPSMTDLEITEIPLNQKSYQQLNSRLVRNFS